MTSMSQQCGEIAIQFAMNIFHTYIINPFKNYYYLLPLLSFPPSPPLFTPLPLPPSLTTANLSNFS